MAEKNNRKSIQTGSDAVFDIMCSPCGEDGAREEAVQYCPSCQEYLCSACAKCHLHMKATRDHVLVGARQAKQNPVAASTTVKEKCWYHTDRNIEMYCGTHNMVYCARCIATEHRSCSGVTDIEHATKDNYSVDELQGLQSEINDIYEQLDNIGKKKEQILAETEEQKTNILGRIKDLKKKMVDHIEKLEKAATHAIQEKYIGVKKELEEDMSNVSKMIGKVGERKKKMSAAAHMDEGQRFVEVKLAQKVAADAITLCKENASKNHKTITFIEDKGLSYAIMKKQAFGQINVVARQNEFIIKTIDMETEGDGEVCLIPDLCQLPDGTVLLIDQRNLVLKKLDINYKAIRLCGLTRVPTAICCTEMDEVAVKFMNSQILVLSINDTSPLVTVKKVLSIKDGGLWGMAYLAGCLWVSCRYGVNVYSMNGLHVNSVTHVHDHSGKVIALSSIHLAASKDAIFVANGHDGVYCFNKYGYLIDEFHDDRLRFTRGVYVTSRGTVFVSGSYSNNVVLFNKKGKCLGEMVSEERMCHKGPLALLFDYKRNYLLITNNSSSNIIVVD